MSTKTSTLDRLAKEYLGRTKKSKSKPPATKSRSSVKRKRPEEDPLYLASLQRDREYLQKQQKEQEQELASRRQSVETRRRQWENQPGFYLLPGDGGNEDLDGNEYATTGPYGLFAKAGYTRRTPGYDDLEDSGIDVEDDAVSVMNRFPSEIVSIIWSTNPREAVAGHGHVWWKDGIFFGPPVDARQRRFNF